MSKTKSTRFERKVDVVFWLIIAMLPLILYIVNVYNGGSNDFFAFVSANFNFAFVSDIISNVFLTAFGSVSPVSVLLSYFVSVEFLHIIFDVIVFLPRFARHALGKVVE